MLDRQQFEQWLQSREPGSVVGEACNSRQCPIASYLYETVPESWPQVLSEDYQLDWRDNDFLDLPPWAQHFVEEIDKADDLGVYAVTVEHAQAVLANIGE